MTDIFRAVKVSQQAATDGIAHDWAAHLRSGRSDAEFEAEVAGGYGAAGRPLPDVLAHLAHDALAAPNVGRAAAAPVIKAAQLRTLADAASGAQRPLPAGSLAAAARDLAAYQLGRPAAGAKRTLADAAREHAGRTGRSGQD